VIDSARLIVGAVIFGIVLAILLAVGNKVADWRNAALRVPGLEQSLTDAKATIDLQRIGAEQAKRVSHAFQIDLTAIRAERDRLRDLPPRVVRVYVPGPAIAVPSPVAVGRPRATRPGPVELTGEAGQGPRLSRDIGADLYGIVDDSDAREASLASQVTRLQQAYAVATEACGAGQP
jgi:hypothetical protein